MDIVNRILNHPWIAKGLPVVGLTLGGLVLSWLAARLTRWLVRRSGLEALAEKAGVAKLLYAVGARRGLAQLLGTAVFLCGVVATLSALAELAGLPGIAAATSALVGFAPRLLAAGAVCVAGLLVADIVRNIVRGVSRRRDDLEAPDVIGNVAYYAVLTLAMIMAIDQIGFKTDLVDSLVRIAFGIVLLSLGIGFALGSRSVFQNLLARQYFQALVQVGDRITVEGRSGVVVRFSRVAAVIAHDDGTECIIPCKLLIEQCVPLDRGKARPASTDQPTAP